MAGVPYDGGGVRDAVAQQAAGGEHLLGARVAEGISALGTTTVEVKSGYGLTVDDEEH